MSRFRNSLYSELQQRGLNVKDYGAKGDGVTNDTTAFQNAMSALSAMGGGVLLIPSGKYVVSNLSIPSYVTLMGQMHTTYGFSSSGVSSVLMPPPAGGAIINCATGTQQGISIYGVDFWGLGALGSTVTQGIVFSNTSDCSIVKCNFFNIQQEAIYQQGGGTLNIDDCRIFGCSRQGTFASRTGSLRLLGNDNTISNCEVGGNPSNDQTNLWNCALHLDGTANMFTNCVFEGSDIGACITGPNNSFSNCRCDINYGHGWYFTRENPAVSPPWRNIISNCWGHRNSKYGNNLFDNFRVETGQSIQGIQVTNCKSSYNNADGWAHRNGFYDGAADTFVTNFRDDGALTSWFSGAAGYAGPMDSFNQAVQTFAAGNATPSVSQGAYYRVNNTGTPTTITNFTNGVNGQIIRVQPTDSGATTIANGTIKTYSGANITTTSFRVYEFMNVLGTWYQINAAT